MTLKQRRLRLSSLAVVVAGGVMLGACGSSGPSVATRAGQSATTTSSSAPASTTTTTTATTLPANLQRVTFDGLAFEVSTSWPVYTLSTDPSRCVRYDLHAVYLGQEGATPQCPANPIGHTDTVQVEPLNAQGQTDARVATQAETLNGLSVRVDPNPTTSGAFTVVFPSLQLVAIVTIGTPATGEQIVASFQHA